jgi:O-glycosyl hydrolase
MLMRSGALLLLLGLSLGCATNQRDPVGPPEPPRDTTSGTVGVWVTTGDRYRLLARQSNLSFRTGQIRAPFTLQVDSATAYQEMVGFGAAITDASAWLIQTKMSPALRDSLLTQLFSTTRGIGLSFTRVTMGASDFSLDHYSYNDPRLFTSRPSAHSQRNLM